MPGSGRRTGAVKRGGRRMRTSPWARASSAAAVLALALAVAACAPGAPPPGPIDLLRKAIDPSYDYTESPDTWGSDEDDRRSARDGRSGCPRSDLICTYGDVTICCAPSDGCCAGRSGPYCCEAGTGYGDDGSRWYDGSR